MSAPKKQKGGIKYNLATATKMQEELRQGAVLDRKRMAAVADGITALFDELASRWGGKIYFSPAAVELFRDGDEPHDVMITCLTFRKRDRGWRFLIETSHVADVEGESYSDHPIGSASLETRLAAVAALPKLEEELKAARDRQRADLVSAMDFLSAHVEAAGDGQG